MVYISLCRKIGQGKERRRGEAGLRVPIFNRIVREGDVRAKT